MEVDFFVYHFVLVACSAYYPLIVERLRCFFVLSNTSGLSVCLMHMLLVALVHLSKIALIFGFIFEMYFFIYYCVINIKKTLAVEE